MKKYLFLILVLFAACKTQETAIKDKPMDTSMIKVAMSSDQLAAIKVQEAVDQKKVKSQLTFLASDALRGRDTGSPGLEAAAAFIESQFISWGIEMAPGMESYQQDVPFRTFSPPDSTSLIINGSTLAFPQDYIVINGHGTKLNGSFINVGYGSADEIADLDLQMQPVVSIAGDGVAEDPRTWIKISEEKRDRLQKAGASALIEIYQSSSVPWRFLSRFGTQSQTTLNEEQYASTLPNLWVGTSDSNAIASLKNGEGEMQLFMKDVGRERFNSSNVVGYIEGTDPDLKDEYMLYSAHYDHVGIGNADATGDTIYNGARDNGVGTTAVLQLAEYFASNPPKRSSLFVLFTAEEKGLLGSRWFSEHLPVPAHQIKFNYNIDNGGYNDTSIVSVIGLTRTSAEQTIFDACSAIGLEAIEDPAKEQGLFDRSDNVNFAVLGIPAPTFSLGFRAFDDEIFKYYHQPGDQVETLNMDYIEKYVEAYILSAQKIANDPQPPTWNEGDKYYDVGQRLYSQP